MELIVKRTDLNSYELEEEKFHASHDHYKDVILRDEERVCLQVSTLLHTTQRRQDGLNIIFDSARLMYPLYPHRVAHIAIRLYDKYNCLELLSKRKKCSMTFQFKGEDGLILDNIVAAMTCFVIASKFDIDDINHRDKIIDEYPWYLEFFLKDRPEFHRSYDYLLSREDEYRIKLWEMNYVHAERVILNTVEWNMSRVTPHDFSFIYLYHLDSNSNLDMIWELDDTICSVTAVMGSTLYNKSNTVRIISYACSLLAISIVKNEYSPHSSRMFGRASRRKLCRIVYSIINFIADEYEHLPIALRHSFSRIRGKWMVLHNSDEALDFSHDNFVDKCLSKLKGHIENMFPQFIYKAIPSSSSTK